MSARHVLDEPGPLSARARAFLRRHASVVPVDTGPDDDECRAAMAAVLGHVDEGALAALRWTQARYSGLAYRSPLLGDIRFQPVFEVDGDTGRVEFWHGIVDVAPDGVSGGAFLPDGTVTYGVLDVEVPVFPSVDHFLECDALLDHARRLRPLSAAEPADAAAHLAGLRERRPRLRRLEAASGPAVGWWTDDEVLVQVDEFRSRLGSGSYRPPPVVRIWAV
ncbi:hypothetical protein [Saccharothrix hoggarensis]|uniref:Uncharacterized protein n=1 Tax=Saccharothrix hoggarensis TaxID=913853 RepID=A0ABW3QWH1_9PSEU